MGAIKQEKPPLKNKGIANIQSEFFLKDGLVTDNSNNNYKGFSSNVIDQDEVFLDDTLMYMTEEITNLYIDRNIDFIRPITTSLRESGVLEDQAANVLTVIIKSVLENRPDVKMVMYG